jgi:uroporphyrinogen decarboxylase
MNSRERVLAAMRRQIPDHVPKFADFTPEIHNLFLRKTGQAMEDLTEEWKGRPGLTYRGEIGMADPAEYFGYDVRIIEFGDTRSINDFTDYLPADLPANRSRISEWGIAYVRGSESQYESMVHPLAGVEMQDEIINFPWPDVTAPYRRTAALQLINQVHDKGCAVMGWPPLKGGTFFETAWGMRGFEKFMEDMLIRPELAACLLEKIAGFSFSNYGYLTEAGVDILMLGDDFGMQERMLISPAMWRKWFKLLYADLIRTVKNINPDVLIFYHSDGNILPIIPELIEIGVDILNPIQPECMDPQQIKQIYGDKLAFWGTIGTQTTFPHGTPEDIRNLVKQRIRTVGKGGGLLLAPTHKIQPDVPWENITAFFDAVEKYGNY